MAELQADATVLSVAMPIYNEVGTWHLALERVEQAALPGLAKQIILVDDGSRDGTREELQQFAQRHSDLPRYPKAGQIGYKVLLHERNQGKGAALRTAFAAADGQIVAVQDADLEYDPSEFARLVQPILDGRADVVYGSRFRRGRPRGSYLANYLANRVLTAISNFTTGLRLTDMETCYKLLRRDVLRRIVLEQDRFGFEPEITAKLAGLSVRVRELPIRYAARTHEQGKKIGWRDGLNAIDCILRYTPSCRRARRV